MHKGVLGTLAVVASLAIGTGASATTPPTTPPTGQNDPITGAGPSGSVHALPLCPVNTYVDPQSGRSCLPLGVPIPEETTKLATDAPCAATGEMEGFFTDPSQTVAMIECFLPLMGTWITQEWPAKLAPRMVPNNYLLFATAGPGVNPDPAAIPGCLFSPGDGPFYCPWDGNVYLDAGEVWNMYSQIGDVSVPLALAHELGHRFQHADHFLQGGGDPTEEIPTENQADCVAGVFMDWLARNQYLTPGDDAADMVDTLVWLGQFEEGNAVSQRTHGDVDQRLRAFYVGYNSGWSDGLAACNGFVTDMILAGPVAQSS